MDSDIYTKLICLFQKLLDIDIDSLYLHGPVLQCIITNTALTCNNNKLYVFVPEISYTNLNKILMELKIDNLKFMKKYHIIKSQNIVVNMPNCFEFIYNSTKINVIFHMINFKKYMFDCDNLMMNRDGFQLINEFNIIPAAKSICMLNSLHNMAKNQTDLTYTMNVNDIVDNNTSLFNLMHQQNLLLKRGKKIKRGLINAPLNQQSLCSVCYETFQPDNDVYLYVLKCEHIFCTNCIDKHKCSFGLSHNEDCPVCRQKIEFKVCDKSDINYGLKYN